MMFLQRTVKWLNIIFLLEHQVCFFNSRISKTVWAHSETSNIIKKHRTFCLTMDFLSDPRAHGADHWVAFSLSPSVRLCTFLKPFEDLVKIINVVNVVKT